MYGGHVTLPGPRRRSHRPRGSLRRRRLRRSPPHEQLKGQPRGPVRPEQPGRLRHDARALPAAGLLHRPRRRPPLIGERTHGSRAVVRRAAFGAPSWGGPRRASALTAIDSLGRDREASGTHGGRTAPSAQSDARAGGLSRRPCAGLADRARPAPRRAPDPQTERQRERRRTSPPRADRARGAHPVGGRRLQRPAGVPLPRMRS